MPEFVHLHCHTQYSLLDGASEIGAMMDKAVADGQKGVALTDHGNMFGAYKFVAEANKRGIKPMVGCEFYMVEDRHIKSFSRAKGQKDKRYHQLLLAKNRKGYENLCKLCSLGFIEGLYSKYPRIDKELLEQYSEGLIASSCCIGAEIPQAYLRKDDAKAEELCKYWLNLLGDDFYIEIQRHRGLENLDIGRDSNGQRIYSGVSQEDVNQKLLALAEKHNIKVIATNDTHYVEQEDFEPHDILLCINTASLIDDPKRFKFPSSDFYFKSQQEMADLFHDVPESIANTMEVYDKIEGLELARDVLLPEFPVPEGMTEDDFLRQLTYEGAKKRYGIISDVVRERLDFELSVIRKSGYPGYFLIVQDFTTEARRMGVSVGPGRGSAAGSAVAYCVGITNVDPIKYDLLFERFLNPERVSMPDIDIDFDDIGRSKVIDYVLDKYGKNQVAQIITYGAMKAKSSLRDVGRVMNVPLSEVDKVAKSFPDNLAASLKGILAKGDVDPKLKSKLNSEEKEQAIAFRALAAGQDDIGQMIRTAKKLEGSVRNTGIHACGVVITPDDVTNYVPVTVAKDSGLLVSQFDNSVAEDAGLLKMDFLGLKTLTIIKDACRMVKENYGRDLDPDEVPLDDEKTYELFQRGETVGIFQYESGGMQKHMKGLVPKKFEDLIAMNALYRPGPIEYIPEFIERSHGRKPILYDLPEMAEYLHETYGICVTGDTLIHDADTGQRVRIDALENKVNNFYVQGVDSELNTKRGKLSYWVCNGKKPVYRMKLRSGATVKMTSNHKVLTESGWQELGQLSEGDYIAVPRSLEVAETETYDENKLKVLAYLLADGALSEKGTTAEFLNKSEAILDSYKESVLAGFENLRITTLQQVREVTRVMVAEKDKSHYHGTNSLVAQLREWNLKTKTGGCRSHEKFIPEFVFSLNNDLISLFLGCFWDCDGFVGEKFAHIKTISPFLAKGISTLLLRLGIDSTTYESTYDSVRHGKEMTAYQITVYDLNAFAQQIGPHLLLKTVPQLTETKYLKDTVSRELVLDEVGEHWSGSARGLMQESGFSRQHFMPTNRKRPRIRIASLEPVREYLPLERTEKSCRVKWEEIISIEYAGEELVYDITVDEIHNFVGNNVLLHNCVYQEQVMLLSQKLANFTKGEADMLRKAMGKKKKKLIDEMWPKFKQGCADNGHTDETIVGKIWKDWEAFASYAFNKSHSTCYAFVAFQTAYLKAHYPAEFMASVLTHNKKDITKITFFLRECKRMGLDVLGPDVNESAMDFSVNKAGQVRFGMSAIKGVGEGPVEGILDERKNGHFVNVFDMVRRLNLQNVNKRAMESLALSGAFDGFNHLKRSQFFNPSEKYTTFLEHIMKYGAAYQSQKVSAKNSLFGASEDVLSPEPHIPPGAEWPLIEKLNKEKEVTGIYISGHPLDDYRVEVENFVSCGLDDVAKYHQSGSEVKLAGIVTSAQHRISKKGTGWGIFMIQDFNDSMELVLFGDDYIDYKERLSLSQCVFIKGSFKPRWNSDNEFTFKLKEVNLLETIGNKMSESITLNIPLEKLTEKMLSEIERVLKEHKGKNPLKMMLIDKHNKTRLNFASKTRKVEAGPDLAVALERIGVDYKLN